MAIIHQTTLVPAKLELLAGWLPAQPWYRPTGQLPDLARIGGFRLLEPGGGADPADGGPGRVTAPWQRPDGTQAHGIWATARSYPAGADG